MTNRHVLTILFEVETEQDPDCGHWSWRPEGGSDSSWSICCQSETEALEDARQYIEDLKRVLNA